MRTRFGGTAAKSEMLSDDDCDQSVAATPVQSQPCSSASSPFTPLQNIVHQMRKRLEQQFAGSENSLNGRFGKPENRQLTSTFSDDDDQPEKNVSPGLARLQNTPGRGRRLREKQKVLERMHQHAKENADRMNIGGGVSIWPEMSNMRLDRAETGWLVVTCIGLVFMVLLLFNKIHGALFRSLVSYTSEVSSFSSLHPLEMDRDNVTFEQSVLAWHVDFTKLMDEMDDRFNISHSKTSLQYKTCMVLYILAIIILLYYLVDNMLARSKLSPRRIKLWVSLLVVTGGWTLLLLQLLILAQALESSVEETVLDFSHQMSAVVLRPHLERSLFRDVSTTWRVRHSGTTARGVLSVAGAVRVRDVTASAQYYAAPVLTALLTPLLQLVLALRDVYAPPPPPSSEVVKNGKGVVSSS